MSFERGLMGYVLFRYFVFLILHIFSYSLEAHHHVGIITYHNYVGDKEIALRIKIAGERLGWTVIIDENEGKEIQHQKFDWVICMMPKNHFHNPHCPNYITIFQAFPYFDDQKKLNPFYDKYDARLSTVDTKTSLSSLHFLPLTHHVPFKKLQLKDMVVMIPVWGNRLEDPKFKTLFWLLNQSEKAKFYGVNRDEKTTPQNYMGPIPFDGNSVINVLQEHGIVLVLHSDMHNRDGIPSGRIFEAAASSAVIISDENPFVKKHFGDSVYYINTLLSSEEIFENIQEHLINIFLDQENALKKAEKAHQIFIENFTMEKQLLKLEKFHKKYMGQKKCK